MDGEYKPTFIVFLLQFHFDGYQTDLGDLSAHDCNALRNMRFISSTTYHSSTSSRLPLYLFEREARDAGSFVSQALLRVLAWGRYRVMAFEMCYSITYSIRQISAIK